MNECYSCGAEVEEFACITCESCDDCCSGACDTCEECVDCCGCE